MAAGRKKKKKNKYIESEELREYGEEYLTAEDEAQEAEAEDPAEIEALESRIKARRKVVAAANRRRRVLAVTVVLAVFVLIGVSVGRDIVRLKAENRALKVQQAALEEQRDALKEELKNTGNQEYIREQARKQLRLLNPGEILFYFDDEDPAAAGDAGGEDE